VEADLLVKMVYRLTMETLRMLAMLGRNQPLVQTQPLIAQTSYQEAKALFKGALQEVTVTGAAAVEATGEGLLEVMPRPTLWLVVAEALVITTQHI
jgi:hypothetical protein